MSRSPSAERSQEALEDYVGSWQTVFRLMRAGRSWSGSERNRAFLNCGDTRFADVSAVSGLDFPDDGRALAVVDWDQDGDLDLWFHNRTGPRLRLMLNGTAREPDGPSSIAFRLQGTTSNRDGIGARVEVVLAGTPDQPLVQSLHAGDGFLSQSSKWLHFGLGREAEIESVTVRWPGNETETFLGASASDRYLLEEGTGVAIAVHSREVPVELEAAERLPSALDPAGRLYLPIRLPLPELLFRAFETGEESVSEPQPIEADGTRPLLVNIWASWCLPCRGELDDLTEHRENLETVGLDVLALTVDGLDQRYGTTVTDATGLLDELQFTGRAGLATVEMLDKLEMLEELLYEVDLEFGVPLSLLLDRRGALAAVYRGRLDLEVLLDDVASLEASPRDRLDRSAPLGGRWYERLAEADLLLMGRVFRDRYPADMERYFLAALTQLEGELRSASGDPERQEDLREQGALAMVDLALVAEQDGNSEDAIKRLRQALNLQPQLTLAHLNLGRILRENGQHEESLQHYGLAYRSDSENAVARYGLGMAFLALGDLENAYGHLTAASHFAPEMPAPLHGMAWILVAYTNPDDTRATRDALALAERGIELTKRQDARMLDVLAAAHARSHQFAKAASIAQEALDVARRGDDTALIAEISARLARYQAGELPGFD